jgi:hypothetical protein
VYKTSSFENNNSLEAVSTPAAIRSMFDKNGNPTVGSTRVWQVLEHGEKLECLSCIPLVAGLLYDAQPKTREIAAWWLRRRIFGVFGEGQVYSQVLATLADSGQADSRRARAASALGEFLTFAGREPLATAIRNDGSPLVRQSAVAALERMNTDGPSHELSFAMGDGDVTVRLAALHAATRINVFTDVSAIAGPPGGGGSARYHARERRRGLADHALLARERAGRECPEIRRLVARPDRQCIGRGSDCRCDA